MQFSSCGLNLTLQPPGATTEDDGSDADVGKPIDVVGEGLVFDDADREVEAEEDSWFDQLVRSSLSSSDLGVDSQPLFWVDTETGQEAEEAPATLDMFLPEHELEVVEAEAVPENPGLDDKTALENHRPVARPLSHNDGVISIEDSPKAVKCEISFSGPSPMPVEGEASAREKRIAVLKEQLRKLEGCMEKAESEA